MYRNCICLLLAFLAVFLTACAAAPGERVREAAPATTAAAAVTAPPVETETAPVPDMPPAPEEKTVKSRGVDVSRWQGDVDWNAVKASGADFAMVRLGTRPEDGLFYTDSMAKTNLAGAAEAGLSVGAYFYTVPTSPEKSREDARWMLSFIEGCSVTCPLAYDVEEWANKAGLTAAARTDCVLAFAEEIRAAGHEPMLYVLLEELEDPALWERDRLEGRIRLWVARYDAPVYPEAVFPDGREYPDAWQYSNTGSVPGISGKVDLDVFYF